MCIMCMLYNENNKTRDERMFQLFNFNTFASLLPIGIHLVSSSYHLISFHWHQQQPQPQQHINLKALNWLISFFFFFYRNVLSVSIADSNKSEFCQSFESKILIPLNSIDSTSWLVFICSTSDIIVSKATRHCNGASDFLNLKCKFV